MNRRFVLQWLALAPLAAYSVLQAGKTLAHPGKVELPIIGGPCDGCENAFVDYPDTLQSSMRIASVGEPGEPLHIEGQVLTAEGAPASGIVVYAYHTNAQGKYPRGKTRHGNLRGWAITDATGRYQFATIRPGSYPGEDLPQHVHMHVIEPGRFSYTIDDLLFDDDPKLTPKHRQHMRRGRGGDGLAIPQADGQGGWRVRRDIRLGQAIHDYPHP